MPWGSLKRVSGSRVRFISSSALPSPAGSQLCRCRASAWALLSNSSRRNLSLADSSGAMG